MCSRFGFEARAYRFGAPLDEAYRPWKVVQYDLADLTPRVEAAPGVVIGGRDLHLVRDGHRAHATFETRARKQSVGFIRLRAFHLLVLRPCVKLQNRVLRGRGRGGTPTESGDQVPQDMVPLRRNDHCQRRGFLRVARRGFQCRRGRRWHSARGKHDYFADKLVIVGHEIVALVQAAPPSETRGNRHSPFRQRSHGARRGIFEDCQLGIFHRVAEPLHRLRLVFLGGNCRA
mmetsp:Transcript_40037/g.121057  ORF Transcript_40037/g.121057 Transcript_40037/m.121057 type:complete len:231 (-) Transcript_40037:639-1331(-)